MGHATHVGESGQADLLLKGFDEGEDVLRDTDLAMVTPVKWRKSFVEVDVRHREACAVDGRGERPRARDATGATRAVPGRALAFQ